jgi:hypothetical protein
MRDVYVRTRAEKETVSKLLAPDSWLFITSNFKQANTCSTFSFFFKSKGYTLTTGLIRKVVETQTQEMVDKGAVTKEQQGSVQNTLGHSDETARSTYIIPRDSVIARQRTADAKISGRVMSQFVNSDVNSVLMPDIDIEKILNSGKPHGTNNNNIM